MSKPRKKLSAYQRIVRAAKRGTGVLLFPDEVRRLARDDAIVKVAEHDDETSTMRHCWVNYGREQCEECERCGLRRRQRSAGFGKRITEYWIRGEGWTWVKSREPVPKCKER